MGARTASAARARFSRVVALLVSLVLVLPLVVGFHWVKLGWRDQHDHYPKRPTGYRQIVHEFGRPCGRNANWNRMKWRAADNHVWYPVLFHRKLGGVKTRMVSGERGRSTNLDNDVYGHIQNRHLGRWVKSGIFGYACRFIAGTRKWSTHAWGIAIDVSARYEPCCNNFTSSVNRHHASIWKDHRWTWGRSFGDPMHFQYADGY